ncbi:ferrous iron transport protein B [Poseidonibacter lekithochrous]|uniref:ferrous iron transport protein B n=1 Tax=Poseidonibacter lekithochrous TaxID=1904463 RepID=UPI0008FC2799|nr:ferrous iron transport protein B [Poseidonibacter lekithochrous]QKJ21854.1 ferrous iron transport protein B [Poseidonibacter lekithochrous]
MNNIQVALVGQPNCGKSTIFNMLTNIKQHIANYPGVTIDKKSGSFNYKESKIEVIDLPGTYSFSSYSVEEKITRDYILNKDTDIIINTVDASNLRRNLYLTMQLLDMHKPMIIAFNMIDVAKQNGLEFDLKKLQKLTNAKIIETVASKKQGLDEIKESIVEVKKSQLSHISNALHYKELQKYIDLIKELIDNKSLTLSKHYISVKLFENDAQIIEYLKQNSNNAKQILDYLEKLKEEFKEKFNISCEQYIVKTRYEKADEFLKACSINTKKNERTFSDKIDSIVLNKYLALPILASIIFTLYQLSIVYGYELTTITWPILSWLKTTVVSFFPQENIDSIPYITQFAIWMMNSVNALLNYLPIFFILFFLLAILEDVGYMPRMAFILDRLFVKFGLHGESTLPLVLSGIFAGGCAVPGVMATKGMNDKKAQMATMLTIPLMNCLAKIPFFTLILAAFFQADMALMMFLISTVTIFVALSVSKVLTLTVLKAHETTPFIMELPSYHIPTLRGIFIKVFDKIWLYLKKIVTIVAAVAVVLFVLIQFPGISKEKKEELDNKSKNMQSIFYKKIQTNKYYSHLDEKDELKAFINFYNTYRSKRMNTTSKEKAKEIDSKYKDINPYFFLFTKPKRDKEAKKINRAFKKLLKTRKALFRETKDEKVENSALGSMGKFFVPLTQYAGFDWKINVAFLSSFAARESSVATIGALYESNKEDPRSSSIASSSSYTPLGAVAIIIFMALTPPCIATMIMIKVQTNSYKWMFFALSYPMVLGLLSAIFIFQVGSFLNLSGVEAMVYFYIFVLSITMLLSLIPNYKKENYV